MRLLLTGTPGTGKTTTAKTLAKLLNAKLVNVNALIAKKKLFKKKRGEREKTVKLAALKRALEKILKTEKNVIVESHLLCEMRLSCEKIIVFRCHPRELEKRLRARGYPFWKIRENVLCETLDYCLVKTLKNYGSKKTLQVDFTKPVRARVLLKKILAGKSDSVNYAQLLLEDSFKKRLSIF